MMFVKDDKSAFQKYFYKMFLIGAIAGTSVLMRRRMMNGGLTSQVWKNDKAEVFDKLNIRK